MFPCCSPVTNQFCEKIFPCCVPVVSLLCFPVKYFPVDIFPVTKQQGVFFGPCEIFPVVFPVTIKSPVVLEISLLKNGNREKSPLFLVLCVHSSKVE